MLDRPVVSLLSDIFNIYPPNKKWPESFSKLRPFLFIIILLVPILLAAVLPAPFLKRKRALLLGLAEPTKQHPEFCESFF